MELIRIDELKGYTSKGHYGVIAREVAGAALGVRAMKVVQAVMDEDGGAEEHVHPESEHLFVVLEGGLAISSGSREELVREGEALLLRPGEPHAVRAAASGKTRYILVTAPPAASSHP